MFEGVEAKNILRTAVIRTLLNDPEARVVLLMKNQERVERYQKEFNEPRLLYQVVPEYHRGPISSLDKMFSNLKFFLLRTDTTALLRRIAFEENGGYVTYYGGGILKFIFARSFVRTIARFLDFLLVRSDRYAKYFDTYNPQLVLLAHLFEEPEIHLLREAKRRGVTSIGFVNSWDKITARCIMRLLPDKAVVFNEMNKRQLMEHDEMRAEDIAVAGIPQYDYYTAPNHSSREAFCGRLGIDPRHKLIVYAPIGSKFSTSDWDMIDYFDDLMKRGTFGERVSLLVRFQPNDFLDERELSKRSHLLYDYPGKRFASKRGVDWDMDEADLTHLKDTLSFINVLICYASSLSVDAAMFDKPVININFEITKSDLPSKSPTKFYQMTHYKEALRTGGIRLVHDKEELIAWTKRYLADPALDHEGRARLVREQCGNTDGNAGVRIGEFILSNLR